MIVVLINQSKLTPVFSYDVIGIRNVFKFSCTHDAPRGHAHIHATMIRKKRFSTSRNQRQQALNETQCEFYIYVRLKHGLKHLGLYIYVDLSTQ